MPEYIKDETSITSKRKNAKRRIIGIQLAPLNNQIEFKKLGPAMAFYYAVGDTLFMCKYILIHIGNLLIGKADISGLSGPVGIAQISGDVAKLGLLPFILLIAHISISLGLVNLLPIPVLDGGQLTMLAIEEIRGEPLPARVENFAYTLGALMVGFLLVFAVTNDIFRWVG